MNKGHEVHALTNPNFSSLFDLMPGITFIEKPVGHYDQSWVMEHGSKASFKMLKISSKKKSLLLYRSQQLKWWHHLIYDEVLVKPTFMRYRALYNYMEITGENEQNFNPPQIETSNDLISKYNLSSREYHVLHPTSAWKEKSWSPTKWVDVIEALYRISRKSIIVTSGSAQWETEYCSHLTSLLSVPVLNLSGKTDLPTYIQVLGNCHTFLGIDGSASHIAQAAGAKSGFTLFGKTSPSTWHWHQPNFISYQHPDKNINSVVPEIIIPMIMTLIKE